MKFIHLSDTHLLPRSRTIIGIDACARLEAAVASIRTNFSDAAFCMVTGDLTDEGDAQSYQEFRKILDQLPMPWYPLLGNHDIRSVARENLGDLPWHSGGFLQYEFETAVGQFIVLDSLVDMDTSYLNEDQLNWLEERLSAAQQTGQDVYLFMHHVPFNIGIPWMDRLYQMDNGEDLATVLKRYNNIRHMFFGHVHRPIHGSWHGIPFSIVRSTAHQVALDLEDDKPKFIAEPPSYGIVLVEDNQVVIHDHSFLEENSSIIQG